MRRTRFVFARAVALASTTLALMGCASVISQPLHCPADGGPAWTELATPHFLLATDVPSDEAREELAEFERVYAAIRDLGFGFDLEPRDQLRVVLYANDVELHTISSADAAGFFLVGGGDWDEPPTAVLYGRLENQTRALFQHELTHRFVRFYFPQAPIWLNEGLAEYMSTLRFEDGKVILGEDLPNRSIARMGGWATRSDPVWGTHVSVPIDAVPPVAKLLAGDADAFYTERRTWEERADDDDQRIATAHYMGAWSLVHLFSNGADAYRRRFAAMRADLAAGRPFAATWTTRFGDLPPERLEADFRDFLRRRDTTVLRAAYQPPPAPAPKERALLDADAHVLFAQTRERGSSAQQAQIPAELAEALRTQTDHAEALYLSARREAAAEHPARAIELLERATKAAPAEPRYLAGLLHVTMLQLSPKSDPAALARTDALASRLAGMARAGRELDLLARYSAARGRNDEALSFALRATRADPSCARCAATAADAWGERGSFSKAVIAMEIAIGLVPESGRAPADWARRLEEYRAAAHKPQERPAAEPTEPKPPAPP